MSERGLTNLSIISAVGVIVGAIMWWNAPRVRDPDQTGALTRSGPTWTCPDHYVLFDTRGSDPVCLHGMKATRSED